MELELLTRKDCGLCDEFAAALTGLLENIGEPGRLAVVVAREVDSDPELQRRYGRHVPVLRVGGAVLSAHRLDPQRVAAALGGQRWEPIELN